MHDDGRSMTTSKALRIDPRDNVIIALADFRKGETLAFSGEEFTFATEVRAKHKFATRDFAVGDKIIMYGVLVGKAVAPIARGEAISTGNIRHEAAEFHAQEGKFHWTAPDVGKWRGATFRGYHRSDGRVGTRNYWIVLPMVFCENRNLNVMKQAFEEELGFAAPQIYRQQVAELVELYREGKTGEIAGHAFSPKPPNAAMRRVFPNVDGIKFLLHEAGCGGTQEDARNLCGLLAGYICHPNVAGATVLSLGCQHAQVGMLREEIAKRAPDFRKPLLVYEQQKSASENAMLSQAVRDTFLGVVEANKMERAPADISHLCVGLKCGGSDGFSGITANPAIGHTADVLAALGGTGILSEFPELCGVEQELINRCESAEIAERFMQLMRNYEARAKAVFASFEMNPSPGNIRDGLITDAMKSAGAAKKGGTSPVTSVLDYPERATKAGLNLLCTPGNDVECVTAQTAAGANIVLFTTGLGTPTGNPVTPVMKIATNSILAGQMADIIDFDTGGIVMGETSIEKAGEDILEEVLRVASGEVRTKAELLGQDDFIPWKRGVSL
jgi:altronate hydrolase